MIYYKESEFLVKDRECQIWFKKSLDMFFSLDTHLKYKNAEIIKSKNGKR